MDVLEHISCICARRSCAVDYISTWTPHREIPVELWRSTAVALRTRPGPDPKGKNKIKRIFPSDGRSLKSTLLHFLLSDLLIFASRFLLDLDLNHLQLLLIPSLTFDLNQSYLSTSASSTLPILSHPIRHSACQGCSSSKYPIPRSRDLTASLR